MHLTLNCSNVILILIDINHHGVTQYVGGLCEFVLWDAAVHQNGLQQTRVVQVDGVVSVLKQTRLIRHSQRY